MQIDYFSALILMISFVTADIFQSYIKAVRNTRPDIVITRLL